MTEILRALITVFVIYLIIKTCRLVTKRLSAVRRLRSLAKIAGARVRILKFPIISYFRLSSSPEAIAEVGNKVYLIRFFNGRSGLSFVHFASDRFAVTYSKIHISIGNIFIKGARRGYARGQSAPDTSRQKVYIIPQIEVAKEYEPARGREVIEVLMLCPEPCEVTYVTETKNAIKAAFTGDEVYGRRIFTPDTFVTFADRAKRQEEYDRQRGNLN